MASLSQMAQEWENKVSVMRRVAEREGRVVEADEIGLHEIVDLYAGPFEIPRYFLGSRHVYDSDRVGAHHEMEQFRRRPTRKALSATGLDDFVRRQVEAVGFSKTAKAMLGGTPTQRVGTRATTSSNPESSGGKK